MTADPRQSTHWHGCWAAYGHHECAQAEVAALRADRDAARALAADRREALDRQTENAAIFLADRDTLLDALTNIPCRRVPGPPCSERVYDKTPCIRCAALERVRSHTGKDPA